MITLTMKNDIMQIETDDDKQRERLSALAYEGAEVTVSEVKAKKDEPEEDEKTARRTRKKADD